MEAPQGTVLIPVSFGELLDKISILNIKLQRIKDFDLQQIVGTELMLLRKCASACPKEMQISEVWYGKLGEVNSQLWNLEDSIRHEYKREHKDDGFIATLAEKISDMNKLRADIKAEINGRVGSTINEVKQYS